ncbi:type IV pilin protein [Rheinheimera baltica]|uniref:type IV pilin protein n=1 Tax=Rheinheimera baltica TaxID=67576 RepID=UPI00273E34BC|nr:type IV pilin protein [Rheinheimera baltica]MDP5150071.1 type IV pilin protein [Rheinheimera baltica]
MKNKHEGFTLVEMVVVLGIFGVITAIAYPSYIDHILKSNRAAAAACLTEVSQTMERGYTAAFTYAGIALPALQCIDDLGERYNFSLANQAARTFTAIASPVGVQTQDECGALTLNQAGARGANGGSDVAVVRKCW